MTATDVNNNTATKTAIVTVTSCIAPSISLNPVSITVCEKKPATFSVTAAGSGLTYQWRKNSVNISGATASNIIISPAIPTDAGCYDVVVKNSCAIQ